MKYYHDFTVRRRQIGGAVIKNIASLELINKPKCFPIRAKHLAQGMSGNEHHALDADRGEH